MFYTIVFYLEEKEFHKLKVEDFFLNISYERIKNLWKIIVISKDLNVDRDFLNFLLKNETKLDIKPLRRKNWVEDFRKNHKTIQTDFFSISQEKRNVLKKNNLIIPASTAFGTGNHFSTFLSILNIEWIFKKKNFLNCLDVGTGTGILSFVINQLNKRKVIALDIDEEAKVCFYRNKKINKINNVFFDKCNFFYSKHLNGKKFDLIVANILLLPLKRNVKAFNNHLISGGFLILSGILTTQKNDLINHFGKFNLKLVKNIYINEWESLILKKND